MSPGSASAQGHAERLLADLPNDVPLVAVGYDIGSRIAQAMLASAPDRFAGAILTLGYPGVGSRASDPAMAARFWYQHFHRTPLPGELIDGRPDAVRAYLTYIVDSWASKSGLSTGGDSTTSFASTRAGAFAASIAWYRDNVGYADGRPVTVPTTMLWPDDDPLFPLEWADELGGWFTDVELWPTSCGHFVLLEEPDAVADAIRRRI